jgi:hypothetical protein
MKLVRFLKLLILAALLGACTGLNPEPAATPSPLPPSRPGAGFRYSTYGAPDNLGPDYWVRVGEQMAAKFSGAHPEVIWIVGTVYGDGTYLSFHEESADPLIYSGYADMNEAILDAFDERGFEVWLQVEPGNADMLTLIHLLMNQYKHHPSVVGFGVDVEWYKSVSGPLGEPISDEVAKEWVEAVRSHGPQYQLFLKHWEIDWMPPTYRDGIVFVNDSQQFESLDAMLINFKAWGDTFAPAPVGFQYGYSSDKIWWKELQDPPGDIGNMLLDSIPNISALFWVDFSILDVFPP